MKKTFTTASEVETQTLARSLAKRLRGGEVLCLMGPLGSGKTCFVQGLAAGLGFKGRVTSPTYTLARKYKGWRLNLHHLDLFRLTPQDLPGIGFEDFLNDPAAACAIEWAEIAGEALPADRLEVRITTVSEQKRRFVVEATGSWSRRILT